VRAEATGKVTGSKADKPSVLPRLFGTVAISSSIEETVDSELWRLFDAAASSLSAKERVNSELLRLFDAAAPPLSIRERVDFEVPLSFGAGITFASESARESKLNVVSSSN
jgi:hypothetical protein